MTDLAELQVFLTNLDLNIFTFYYFVICSSTYTCSRYESVFNFFLQWIFFTLCRVVFSNLFIYLKSRFSVFLKNLSWALTYSEISISYHSWQLFLIFSLYYFINGLEWNLRKYHSHYLSFHKKKNNSTQRFFVKINWIVFVRAEFHFLMTALF